MTESAFELLDSMPAAERDACLSIMPTPSIAETKKLVTALRTPLERHPEPAKHNDFQRFLRNQQDRFLRNGR